MSIDDKMNPYTVDTSYDVSNDRNFLQSADKVNPSVPKTNKFAMALDMASPILSAGFGVMPAFSGKSIVTTAVSAALGGSTVFGGTSSPAGGMYGSQSAMTSSPSGFGGSTGSLRLGMTGPGGGSTGSSAILPPPPPPPPPPSSFGGLSSFGTSMPSTTTAGGLSGMGSPDQFQGQIDNMFNNNMMFLMIQTKVQNMSQQVQTVSNIMKADADSRLNAIRNFRS